MTGDGRSLSIDLFMAAHELVDDNAVAFDVHANTAVWPCRRRHRHHHHYRRRRRRRQFSTTSVRDLSSTSGVFDTLPGAACRG